MRCQREIIWCPRSLRRRIPVGILVTAVDLLGRLLIIERSEAMVYIEEPAVPLGEILPEDTSPIDKPSDSPEVSVPGDAVQTQITVAAVERPSQELYPDEAEPLSLLASLWRLVRSPRAVAVLLSTLIYG